eukprot:Tbor_TRINITY_DN4319_c0_g1::TRINITY_DN4319_c0_g1_i1::g.7768::m.7768
MARASVRIGGGGGAVANLIEQPYYLKPVPGNPFIGAVHDGTSTGFEKGYSFKPMNWLYRFRHNSLPIGIPRGFYGPNPMGKHVHWLEVSTIEKVRIQMFSEEAIGPTWLSFAVVLFTVYHSFRYLYGHPDLTMYNLVMWTTKPLVTFSRTAEKHRIDQPVFRYIQRCPEIYMRDDIRDLYRLGYAANDPFLERVKAAGREDELYLKPNEYTRSKPNLRNIFENDVPRVTVCQTPRM